MNLLMTCKLSVLPLAYLQTETKAKYSRVAVKKRKFANKKQKSTLVGFVRE